MSRWRDDWDPELADTHRELAAVSMSAMVFGASYDPWKTTSPDDTTPEPTVGEDEPHYHDDDVPGSVPERAIHDDTTERL